MTDPIARATVARVGVEGHSPEPLARFVAREALAYAAKGLLLPLSRLGPRSRPRPGTDNAPTLLMVHGYGSGRGAFTPLARFLRTQHELHLAAFGYFTAGRSFDGLGARLAAFAREIAPRGPLLFLGHSIGGLLCRATLQRDETLRARTLGICTLGTPHQGLAAPRALCALPVIGKLTRGSATLRRLQAEDSLIEAIPALSIISTRDHFVRSPDAAAFGRAEVHTVDHVGHVGVLFDASVQARIAAFLHEVAATAGDQELHP